MKEVDIPAIMRILKKEFYSNRVPVVDLIEAQTEDPFKVLLATILSARTKDETTRDAALRLFRRVNKPSDLDRLSIPDIERLIYPVGFYKNKARYLKRLPKAIQEFKGKLPDEVDELVKLPGVGRKTANLVVAVGFKKPAICVDVHVHRITNRWGYLKTHTPLETEMALRKKLPKRFWLDFNSYVVSFGQHTCNPVRPWCSRCPIIQYCNQVGVASNR